MKNNTSNKHRTFMVNEPNMKIDETKNSTLTLNINRIKGISGTIEIPLSNGVYAIVGNNGSGKSTIMSLLSRLVPPYSFRLSSTDYCATSQISYSAYDKNNSYVFTSGKSQLLGKTPQIKFYGRYEGSLFYGTRFEDSRIVDSYMQAGRISEDIIVPADEYVIKKLGYILHNDELYYSGLKRLRNRAYADEFGFKNLPYFYEVNNNLISQYRMSSGECLLISLIHFLYNSIIRKSIPSDYHAILLVDELELALHPVAIKRLTEELVQLANVNKNLTCIISTHSLEIIRSLSPHNMYNINLLKETDSLERKIMVETPVYPCYLMKEIYSHNGYDFVILVEDTLAQKIVEKTVNGLGLRRNKLINIVPGGGWTNLFELHNSFVKENTLGISTTILTVIDGDVKSEADGKFRRLKHLFLPIPSIEKFILAHISDGSEITREFKSIFFNAQKTIEDFVKEYNKEENQRKESAEKEGLPFESDKNGKRLYRKFKKYCLDERRITEDQLVDEIFHIVERCVSVVEFEEQLKLIICE